MTEEVEKSVDKYEKFQAYVQDYFSYISEEIYPSGLSRGQKKDFRRRCSAFKIKDGALYFTGNKEGKF